MMIEALYDLHKLGWHSFQQLCLSITREILGQTVESFLDTHDGGQDGAFSGIWKTEGMEDLTGRFVIQCKFTSKKDAKFTEGDLTEEFKKVDELVRDGLCDSYILLTNAGISGVAAKTIEKKLKILGVKGLRIHGLTWICQQIHESNRLRMMVPRVYGLGDLSQILDERAYKQAERLLASMRDDLSKIVITEAYNKAAAALNKHGFVLLVGEPAAGKTTIASMLAMAALDQWDSYTLKLDSPEQVVDRWNPDFNSQFFWVDDCFGVTQYEKELVQGWNHKFPQIKTMLGEGKKIVMTTRNYIYKRARNDLKTTAFPLLNESQVVIDVHNLTKIEKQQILYNHLKLGNQSLEFIKSIKPFLNHIADHPRFIPEMARRLSDPVFTKNLYVGEYYLNQFIIKQESFLQDVLLGLDIHSKAALALIYMNSGNLKSPIELEESEIKSINRLGSDIGECITALQAMDGSLVQFTMSEDLSSWRFKHPTIGDAYSASLVESPELLGIYIQGAPVEMLVEQITCGDVGLEKAVIVPKNLFESVMGRLTQFKSSDKYKTGYYSTWNAKRVLYNFLSRRCSAAFLKLYIAKNLGLLDKISKPGLYLRYSEEVDLAVKLHKVKLLPEKNRIEFIETIINYAISGEDLYGLDSDYVRTIFTNSEFEVFKQRVRDELVPKLGDVRRNWESDFGSSEENADEYMERYKEMLNTVIGIYETDEDVVKKVELEANRLEDWVSENLRSENIGRSDRKLDEVVTTTTTTTRNIFDDIDER